jgi:hypothetical protein
MFSTNRESILQNVIRESFIGLVPVLLQHFQDGGSSGRAEMVGAQVDGLDGAVVAQR